MLVKNPLSRVALVAFALAVVGCDSNPGGPTAPPTAPTNPDSAAKAPKKGDVRQKSAAD
jgi:hypothetical protein